MNALEGKSPVEDLRTFEMQKHADKAIMTTVKCLLTTQIVVFFSYEKLYAFLKNKLPSSILKYENIHLKSNKVRLL